MRKMWRTLGAIALMTAMPALAQEKMSLADEEQAKVDVTAALQNYMKVFSAQDAKGVAEKVWAPVAVDISEKGVSIIEPAAQTSRVAGTIKQLVASGWDRTDTPTSTVCLVTRNVAFISGDYRRLRKDGSVIEQRGSVNVFAKLPDGWKMVGRFISDPGKTVTCNGAKPSSSLSAPKADVHAAGTNYMTQFSARNPRGMSQDVYNHPAIQVGRDGVSVIDPVKQQADLEAVTRRFISTGWNKTAWTKDTNICLINTNVALMSGPFARFDASEKQISGGGETQLFAKTPQGWKLVLLLSMPPEKMTTCND